MQTIKKLTRNSFLFSVIFHLSLLLFLLITSTIMTRHPEDYTKRPPQLYIPSYVYKNAMTSMVQHPITEKQTATKSQAIQTPPRKTGALPLQEKSVSTKSFSQKSIWDMSQSMIQQNQVNTAINRLNDNEAPILLVGDRHAIVDPLAKLVGRSLSAHFHYPQIEGIFGARGIVYVEMVLHPEGNFSEVRIVKSSDIQDFNAAALYAVNTAPKVVGVDKFLPKAKRIIVGFIFD